VLRCLAGPLVHKLGPLGLLVFGSALAIAGLVGLSRASGVVILVAATIYGFWKAFFWPTMLGVVSEQYPKGGALTLNCIGGVGMLGLSVGMVFLGNIQDRTIEKEMLAHDAAQKTELHQTYLTDEKQSTFGGYFAVDQSKLAHAPEADLRQIEAMQAMAKKKTLSTAALFPVVMLGAYLALIAYYKRKGGYKARNIDQASKVSNAPDSGAVARR
jgi:hypothetical protein